MPSAKKSARRRSPARRPARPEELDHRDPRRPRAQHKVRRRRPAEEAAVVMTGVSARGSRPRLRHALRRGQRRYVEPLRPGSSSTRWRSRATIRGLSPTISIEQKTTGNNPRSTVGTITEISDYLRVLWARTGKQHCHVCGDRVESQTAEQIAKNLAARGEGTRLILLAPLLVNRKGEHRELLEEARRAGWLRLRVDGEIVETEGLESLDKRKKHHVEAVIDRLVVKPGIKSRLTESVETALRIGDGQLIASVPGDDDETFSETAPAGDAESPSPSSRPRHFPSTAPRACAATATVSARASRSIPTSSCPTLPSRSTKARSSPGARTSRRRTAGGAASAVRS